MAIYMNYMTYYTAVFFVHTITDNGYTNKRVSVLEKINKQTTEDNGYEWFSILKPNHEV